MRVMTEVLRSVSHAEDNGIGFEICKSCFHHISLLPLAQHSIVVGLRSSLQDISGLYNVRICIFATMGMTDIRDMQRASHAFIMSVLMIVIKAILGTSLAGIDHASLSDGPRSCVSNFCRVDSSNTSYMIPHDPDT